MESLRINRMSRIKDFINDWDAITSLTEDTPIKTSISDNINIEGTSSCFESFVFTKKHPSFTKAIEAKIRPLVILLVRSYNCITYSSCQGHFSTLDNVDLREMHVGILPRSKAEYEYLLDFLIIKANIVNSQVQSSHVIINIKQSVLTSEENETDLVSMPCIDVFFSCISSEDYYFADLNRVCIAFVDELAFELGNK